MRENVQPQKMSSSFDLAARKSTLNSQKKSSHPSELRLMIIQKIDCDPVNFTICLDCDFVLKNEYSQANQKGNNCCRISVRFAKKQY